MISQGPPPDPALASSWGQLTSLRHNGTPRRDPFLPAFLSPVAALAHSILRPAVLIHISVCVLFSDRQTREREHRTASQSRGYSDKRAQYHMS